MSGNNQVSGILVVFAIGLACVFLLAVTVSVMGNLLVPNIDRGVVFLGGLMIGVMFLVGVAIVSAPAPKYQQVQNNTPTVPDNRPFVAYTQAPTVQTVQTPPDTRYHVGGIPDLERERR